MNEISNMLDSAFADGMTDSGVFRTFSAACKKMTDRNPPLSLFLPSRVFRAGSPAVLLANPCPGLINRCIGQALFLPRFNQRSILRADTT